MARGLHEAVRRHGDLLVIGASRRDEYERTFVDTRQVLQDAPSAVAVAPTGYATRLPSLDTIGMETALWTAEAPRVSRDQSRDESHELGDDRSHGSV